jgi:hypothetical protein
VNNNTVVVVGDIMNEPHGNNIIFGHKFNQVYSPFNTLYDATKYSTFVCSKIREAGGDYNINAIKCKFFLPLVMFPSMLKRFLIFPNQIIKNGVSPQ